MIELGQLKGLRMAFPKKNTRTIVVDGCKYFWHLNNNFDVHSFWIVVQREYSKGQFLWVDPYHHDFLITPKTIAQAIQFALSKGWNPDLKIQPMRLAYERVSYHENIFVVLPEDSIGFDHLKNDWV